MAVTSEQIENALVKIKQLQSDEAEIKEAIDNYKRFVADNMPDGESDFGNFHVSVYTYKKYDEAYGKKNAPALWDKFAVEKRVLDSKTARENLSEDDYALFQKPSAGKTVRVDVKDED